jgi:glycosyltransferase involved in cell wall biosynthesis
MTYADAHQASPAPLNEAHDSPVRRRRVLFVLQLPPPQHGASHVGDTIRASTSINAAFDCDFIRISSASIDGSRRTIIGKVAATLRLWHRVWQATRTRAYDLAYITPCATGLPFYKDYLVALIVRRRVPSVIYHFHNKGVAINSCVPRLLKRHFFRGVRVILLSRRLLPDVEAFVTGDRVAILPNGITPLGNPQPAGRPDSSLVTVLFLSNMIRSKGVFVLLEACRILKESGLRFVCRFAGPWYEIGEDEFFAAVTRLGLEGCVEHLGPRFGTQKVEVMLQSDIFAFPSLDECFPLVILEAMSLGLPVIASEEGGIPDIIEHGLSGLMVARNDPVALAQALTTLIQSPPRRREIGEAGLAVFRARFTDAHFERGLLRMLISALEPPARFKLTQEPRARECASTTADTQSGRGPD